VASLDDFCKNTKQKVQKLPLTKLAEGNLRQKQIFNLSLNERDEDEINQVQLNILGGF